MTQYQGTIVKVAGSGGPYAYLVSVGGVPQKDVNGIQTLGAALDGVKADIASFITQGESVQKVVLNAVSA